MNMITLNNAECAKKNFAWNCIWLRLLRKLPLNYIKFNKLSSHRKICFTSIIIIWFNAYLKYEIFISSSLFQQIPTAINGVQSNDANIFSFSTRCSNQFPAADSHISNNTFSSCKLNFCTSSCCVIYETCSNVNNFKSGSSKSIIYSLIFLRQQWRRSIG